MSTVGKILFALLLACAAPVCLAQQLGVLQPVLEQGQPLQKKSKHGPLAPVVTELREGGLYTQLQREAAQGFTRSVLALDLAAQRVAGVKTPQTTWLYLAVEDGGFARRGFWLREGRRERYVDAHYVDLVVDADSIRDGSFEEIFAHEMGHVFLRRVFPQLPPGWSRTPHHSFSVTDYPTAFDEGFATHMQALSRRFTRNEALRAQDMGLEEKPLLGYWLSNVDRRLRTDGVRRNLFVQAQLPLPGAGDAVLQQDLGSLADAGRLKNGQQMLACEGVIATLFYRWLAPGGGDDAALVARYTPLLEAAAALNRRKPAADSPLLLDLVDSAAQLQPDQAARLIDLVLDTTYGATADRAAAQRAEAAALAGQLGDRQVFVPALKSARDALSSLRASALQSPARLRAALGPDIWLAAEGAGEPVLVNLNTAEAAHLQRLGLDEAQAARVLAARREQGAFTGLADFIARADLAAQTATLQRAQERARKAGIHPRA